MKKRTGLSVVEDVGPFERVAQLYDTIIFRETNITIQLNSGGFKTNHTKNCINDLLPEGFELYQEKGTWYVKEPNGGSRTFEDDMIINK